MRTCPSFSALLELQTSHLAQFTPTVMLTVLLDCVLWRADDCIHDLVDPVGVLRTIRRALKRDGIFFSSEPKSGETLADNLSPAMASGYGISTLHCMTVSLAHGGMGLGNAFGPKRYGQSQVQLCQLDCSC